MENEEKWTCDCCGEEFDGECYAVDVNGNEICENCYDNYYFTCEDCGEVFNTEYSYYVEDRDYYVCDRCRDNYYYCEDCDNLFSEDSMHFLDNGTYCDNCVDNHLQIIQSYHTRDLPIEFKYTQEDLENDLIYATKNTEHIEDNMLKFGMEIEVENRDEEIDNNDMARMIRDRFGELGLVFEYDSSVHGFEIITQPMTISYIREHKEDFKELCELLTENGFVSHINGHCGQHIHFSRTYFSDNEDKYLGKLWCFFEKYRSEILKFSRRNDTGWCNFISDNANLGSNTYYKSSKILCDYAKDHSSSHNVAINLQHSSTIELRVFRGTLKFETMMANFEFVNSLVHIIKEQPTRKISFDKVINYKGNEYLQKYCEEKSIFNSECMSDETSNIFKALQNQKDRYEEVKEEVRTNIEMAMGDLYKLSQTIISESVEFNKENESKIKELTETCYRLQQQIYTNIDIINSSTLQKDTEKVEDNYQKYIRRDVNYDFNTLIGYYENIKCYIPNNEYTKDILEKMGDKIKELKQKYANVGSEI